MQSILPSSFGGLPLCGEGCFAPAQVESPHPLDPHTAGSQSRLGGLRPALSALIDRAKSSIHDPATLRNQANPGRSAGGQTLLPIALPLAQALYHDITSSGITLHHPPRLKAHPILLYNRASNSFRFDLSSVGGGNAIDVAPPSPVTDFVCRKGGHTIITKILIANNGVAAVKEIRSVQKWGYKTFGQDQRVVNFVVMATPEDLKVNADYIQVANQYVKVPGGSNDNNYANVKVIVDVAKRAGVHAVWAGWGHASENPKLPDALSASKQKIVFIGPPGSAMRLLGDKILSTIMAQSAQVPTMAWSGSLLFGFDHIFAEGADCTKSRKAMIVALKEQSICGDFQTTVKYLIKTITTGWLDTLISANMTAKRPDNTLAVIFGAVTKAHLQAVATSNENECILNKVQVPDKKLLRTAFTLDFIYENIKYRVLATQSAAGPRCSAMAAK
ncbi:hypothetical protein PCASD_07157 [Puccinia coronata f. sp. avenae]|uniref:Biotin carboxylation domain-containing protein n=2 Tax=Puccinia coronata f. sp. avenae TaxID=200324 RepID=A0A2N5UUL8_9BASI|nr:hypothetical protein PCASD_07157 [Puccinia coronata f. sp. avenae]